MAFVDTGHLFVIHGDLLRLSCDEVLVPTDNRRHVEPHWGRWMPSNRQALTLNNRVSEPFDDEGQRVRYVDTGATRQTAQAEWLASGIRAALESVLADRQERGPRPLGERERALIGMPLFGTGAGGYDELRGEALTAILEATTVATDAGLDVAIVCHSRADYSALQSMRQPDSWTVVREPAHAQARALADLVRSDDLALFLGAGVSRAAGLPGWNDLLMAIAESAHRSDLALEEHLRERPAGVAADLERELGDRFAPLLKAALKAERHSIAHGLLASLRVRQTITTNFDDLYEKAARVPMPDLDVLPWVREPGQRPWVLKLHGDLERGDLVFTEAQYAAFPSDRSVIGSVLQALLLTRHVLFVGYALRDPNVRALAEEISATLSDAGAQHRQIGTIVALTPEDVVEIEGRGDLDPVLVGDDVEGVSASDTRALEIFLDLLAWEASKRESSWLLNPRYASLAGTDDKTLIDALATLDVPAGHRWAALSALLESYGGSDT